MIELLLPANTGQSPFYPYIWEWPRRRDYKIWVDCRTMSTSTSAAVVPDDGYMSAHSATVGPDDRYMSGEWRARCRNILLGHHTK